MKLLMLLIASLGGKSIQSAIDVEGDRAIEPLTEEDSSPIANIETYIPNQHDCPLACNDYANIHSWISYLSIDRLRRCTKPMLLQFSVTQSLRDPLVATLLRSCTLGSDSKTEKPLRSAVSNPKTTLPLAAEQLHNAPACKSPGIASQENVKLWSSNDYGEASDEIQPLELFRGIQDFFAAKDNCDEHMIFAYHNRAVVGVHLGAHLGKETVQSTLRGLVEQYSNRTFPSQLVAEACHSNGTNPDNIFGVAVKKSSKIADLQSVVREWSKGNCFVSEGFDAVGTVRSARMFQISTTKNKTSDHNITSSFFRRSTSYRTGTSLTKPKFRKTLSFSSLDKRATCSYVLIAHGDTCTSLVQKCGITAPLFVKYNPRSGLCSSLQPGNSVCCSAGDPPSAGASTPKPGTDGVCATHLIQNGDTCSALAIKYGVTIDDIEKWNKGKTWAWTECKDMLLGYNLCVSDGFAPMPPPQQGTECGPLVPNTPAPTNPNISLADLNPCPLKACCSNWGFCGVFPGHCDIHAPQGGGPGSKEKGFQNTCVSGCGNEIKSNSDAPIIFERIGYYESWSMGRDCLRLRAEHANTDGNYTHIHWGFAEIDPVSFKVILKDEHKQWPAFKNLTNVKRIVSFGGWAYSTENPGATILRQAILSNRILFAANLAQFVKDEGIDGVDIDWEYPDGVVLGQKTDGLEYLKFLTILKQNLGTKLVSIAAPASYWYLKAFPIDRIAKVVDYIVYMTYDLHGQWDYGNPNSFDSCDSGKCIRSHVNLTETNNALSMITKAGVPNNKIFVGESSYGRSFRMAKDGCWSALCEFTGSRTQSDANPGRCTNTSGYLAQAEINEMVQRNNVRALYDPSSNSDIIVYNGDYISYMKDDTKVARQARWRNLNFAGTVDWAVDLQTFSIEDENIPDRPDSGRGCISGEDFTVNTLDLCEFTCQYGFCPETLCVCTEQGIIDPLPDVKFTGEVEAWSSDTDMNRLCKFACKYGYCPGEICLPPVIDEEVDEYDNTVNNNIPTRRSNNENRCTIMQGLQAPDLSAEECKTECKEQVDAARAAGKTTNYGCVYMGSGTGPLPWYTSPSGSKILIGTCSCDSWILNELAETVLEAMPMIAQIGCYILMSSLKFVLDIGAQFVPVVGKALDAGLDMAATAAQLAAYLYPEEEDPEGAFSWWLKPCGGTDLVPEDIKKLFGILSTISGGITSFVEPKRLRRGSGRRGDEGNPNEKDRAQPTKPGPSQNTKKRCVIQKNDVSKRIAAANNVWQRKECQNGHTHITQLVITSIVYDPGAKQLQIGKPCKKTWSQACYHYSSAIGRNPNWATQSCHTSAASTAYRLNGPMTDIWSKEHDGDKWLDDNLRNGYRCDRDEYPPAYFMTGKDDPILAQGGKSPQGQLMRYIPQGENRGAAAMWKSTCFGPPLNDLDKESHFLDAQKKDLRKQDVTITKYYGKNQDTTKYTTSYLFSATVMKKPEFTITAWEPVPGANSEQGLRENPCWPQVAAPKDPGFVLLGVDPYYKGMQPPYDYKKPYNPPSNGG